MFLLDKQSSAFNSISLLISIASSLGNAGNTNMPELIPYACTDKAVPAQFSLQTPPIRPEQQQAELPYTWVSSHQHAFNSKHQKKGGHKDTVSMILLSKE